MGLDAVHRAKEREPDLAKGKAGGALQACEFNVRQKVEPHIDVEKDAQGGVKRLRRKPGEKYSDVGSFKLSAKKGGDDCGYAGSGKLIYDNADFEVCSDAGCTAKVKSGTKYPFGKLLGGVTLYARAKADTQLDLTLKLDKTSDKRITVIPETTGKLLTAIPNIVKPKLELEYKTVLLDRGTSNHQAGGETKLKPTPTYIVAGYTETTRSPAYTQGGKLELPGKVEAFLDLACTKPFDPGGKITHAQLQGGLNIYLRGKTAGKFKAKLTLDPQAMPDLHVMGPVEQEMGVVDVSLTLHKFDDAANKSAKVPRVAHPQKAMTDKEQVADGRLLMVQNANGDATRAKLILPKLDGSQWPGGTEAYLITLTSGAAGGLKVYSVEHGGKPLDLPLQMPQSKLAAAERVLWVEGSAAATVLRAGVLDIGFDRAPGGLGKSPKRYGDFARFTPVEIRKAVPQDDTAKPLKLVAAGADYKAYINMHATPAAGRKLKIKAELSQALQGIKLYFRWLEDAKNRKAANNGIDIPKKWKDPGRDVEWLDRPARGADKHISAVTDASGKVEVDLTLSQYGGDKAKIGVYIDQDPIQGQYDPKTSGYDKQKPVLFSEITVARRFWVEHVAVEAIVAPAITGSSGIFDRVKAEMLEAPKTTVTRAEIRAFPVPAIWPKYMVKVNGGNGDAVVVSDLNKAQFFSKVRADANKPIKVPILVCDAQWDSDTPTAQVDVARPAASYPLRITTSKLVLDPPLQGGSLMATGTWKAWEVNAAGAKVNQRNGSLAAGDFSVPAARANLQQVEVKLPTGVNAVAGTQLQITFTVKAAKGPYLGEYSPSNKQILAVYDDDPVDFIDTVGHELGHAFRQVTRPGAQPAGVDAHPKQYDKQGSHCKVKTDKCLMYESGPIKGSMHRFCDVCHPYVVVQDMSTLSS